MPSSLSSNGGDQSGSSDEEWATQGPIKDSKEADNAPTAENNESEKVGDDKISSDEGEEGKDKEMKDLFGSDYDSEEEEFKASGIKESPVRAQLRSGLSNDPSDDFHSHSNQLWLPRTPKPSSTAKCFVTKMPNILRLIPEPYTEESIQEEMINPTDETLYRNYVRWRYRRDEKGALVMDPITHHPLRETNSKVVRWEDGTLTLFVGREALYLARQKIANSFLFVNEVSLNEKAFQNNKVEDNATGQKTVLECHGRLDEKLTIRPMTTSSKSHKSLTMSMRAKHNKGVQKLKEYVSELDASREQEQRAKINEDRLRLQHRKKARQTFEYDRGRAARMDASFLEEGFEDDEDDEEEADHVGSTSEQSGSGKSRKGSTRKAGSQRRASFNGDGFNEYRRAGEARRRDRAKSESDEDEEEDADDGDQDSDDDVEEEMIVRQAPKKRRTVEEDSE
uniref:Uncharacterized protein AlNc14C77G5134 n=1 Tax=Albugo laibachii Nc14 TaxID=890382 RepID=F0WET4_9STRA|nr:conserved hypothetical protein [Albugo laibachii Nc14]|eukprot:CCA19716.1 conserved hypothetical protein [Albugo laibachii Nc14]